MAKCRKRIIHLFSRTWIIQGSTFTDNRTHQVQVVFMDGIFRSYFAYVSNIIYARRRVVIYIISFSRKWMKFLIRLTSWLQKTASKKNALCIFCGRCKIQNDIYSVSYFFQLEYHWKHYMVNKTLNIGNRTMNVISIIQFQVKNISGHAQW